MRNNNSKTTRRKALIAGAVALLMIGGGAAYAYWTTTGTGTGSAQTGTVAAITVNQVGTITGMRPGAAPQPLAGTFNNPNSGPTYIATVTVTIGAITQTSGGATAAGCTAADFTLLQPTAVNQDVPAGIGQGTWGGGSIQFKNTTSNQDACKNVTVALAFAAS